MTNSSSLLQTIETYCAERGIAPTTFGRLAVNDGKFVARLQRGGRSWPETHDKVAQYIRENPAKGAEK